MDPPRGFENQDHPKTNSRRHFAGWLQEHGTGKSSSFSYGYTLARSDSSLFTKSKGGKLAIVLVYVDDLILTGDLIE